MKSVKKKGLKVSEYMVGRKTAEKNKRMTMGFDGEKL